MAGTQYEPLGHSKGTPVAQEKVEGQATQVSFRTKFAFESVITTAPEVSTTRPLGLKKVDNVPKLFEEPQILFPAIVVTKPSGEIDLMALL